MKREFRNIDLRNRNSFHVVQHAARLVEFDSAEELRELFIRERPEKWMVLGGGNNVLFTRDYDGVILTPATRRIAITEKRGDRVYVRAEAGVEWDDLVAWAVGHGLWGLENLSLIPGTVGAAPVQNIGAYGSEAKDCLESVECLFTDTVDVKRLTPDCCAFGYRESIFKRELKGRSIILAATFVLSSTPRPNLGYGDVIKQVEALGGPTLRNIREAICSIRRAKLPDTDVLGNAGSFFKNPAVDRAVAERLRAEYPEMPLYPSAEGPDRMKLAAGWLIDRCGLKGYRQGQVGVHEKQALVLVNHGGASGSEVLELARFVQATVKERFGVEIDTEVNII